MDGCCAVSVYPPIVYSVCTQTLVPHIRRNLYEMLTPPLSPTRPIPTQPDPSQPNPAHPNPTRPIPTQPGPTQSIPTRPNPDPTWPAPIRRDLFKPDPTEPDPTRSDPTDPDSTHPWTSATRPNLPTRFDPTRSDATQPFYLHALCGINTLCSFIWPTYSLCFGHAVNRAKIKCTCTLYYIIPVIHMVCNVWRYNLILILTTVSCGEEGRDTMWYPLAQCPLCRKYRTIYRPRQQVSRYAKHELYRGTATPDYNKIDKYNNNYLKNGKSNKGIMIVGLMLFTDDI